MNYKLLNQMINYIEDHLTEDIEYIKLAQIVGVSEYSLQRIFSFIANMSLSEYIRKRRLSKAFEELKTTNIKVIDVAIKYNYDSSISFSRTFKKLFGISPKDCRNTNIEYKLFPVLLFNNDEQYNELNYTIKYIDEITIYCKKISSDNSDDFLFNIRKLYSDVKETGLYKLFNNEEQYGVFKEENNIFNYYVGSKLKIDGLDVITIPKGKYVIFEVGSRNQKDILEVNKNIYSKWLPSTSYKILDNINFELYKDNNCYIYVPIYENKQN